MRSLLRHAAAVLVGLSAASISSGAAAQWAQPPQVAAGAQIGPVAPTPAPIAPTPAPLAAVRSLPPAPPAGGEGSSGELVALGATAIALGLTDAAFIAYDAVMVARGSQPAPGAALAEALVAAPQALAGNLAMTILTPDAAGHGRELAPLVLVPAVTNALTMHGSLGVNPPAGKPLPLYGVSWATGIDVAFTLPAISTAAGGRLFSPTLGAMEMALTAPQIVVAAYGLRTDPHNTAGYASIAAWSGTLFAHGLLSVALPHREAAPPPEPPAPPKPPLLVPASIEVSPAPVAGGGGLRIAGRW